MMRIDSCPSTLRAGFDTYSPKASKMLFNGQKVSHLLDFNLDTNRERFLLEDTMHRISVSGVQEKFPAVVEDGKIRLLQEGERSTHILKPSPWDLTLADRTQLPANEHLTMQIAEQVYGIETAANGLCFTPNGRMVYLTKRFDVLPDGQKLLMEDFGAIVGRNEQTDGSFFKYRGSYEDIAKGIRLYVASWMVDMERFFELVLFNYIYGNDDNHLKNFSLIKRGEDIRLAPAYDLINTGLHIKNDDFGLEGGLSPNIEKSEVYHRTSHPCRIDFQQFGEHIGLNPRRVQRMLDKYLYLPELSPKLIAHSFLNDKMKRKYLRILKERISRFSRNS